MDCQAVETELDLQIVHYGHPGYVMRNNKKLRKYWQHLTSYTQITAKNYQHFTDETSRFCQESERS